MSFYCLKCRKNTRQDKKMKTILLSKCVVCGSKKSRLIKEQETSGLLSNLVIRTALDKIPILGP